MIVACTKKALEFLGVKPSKAPEDTDPLYSWTANLIMLNRRKTLVVINNATKCVFVLYGVTAKSVSKMPDLILSGIRAVLESEYISPDIIEKYLDDCGGNVTFTSSISRSDVSFCNKACERVNYFINLFETDDLLQKKYLPWINFDMIAKEDYVYICQKLITALEQRYGSPVQSAHMAELEVTLDLLTPCKRTLLVPSNINFYQLHRILQKAFEWEDEHMHQFVINKDSMGRPIEIIQPDYFESDDYVMYYGGKCHDSYSVTIREIFETKKKIEYIYDFGDDWTHTIKLKRFINNCPSPYPHCISAIGDAPMEDSGGMYGFAEKMQILNDPKHPDHEWIADWVRGTCWRPVDIDIINRRIIDRHRICISVYYD